MHLLLQNAMLNGKVAPISPVDLDEPKAKWGACGVRVKHLPFSCEGELTGQGQLRFFL